MNPHHYNQVLHMLAGLVRHPQVESSGLQDHPPNKLPSLVVIHNYGHHLQKPTSMAPSLMEVESCPDDPPPNKRPFHQPLSHKCGSNLHRPG